MSTVIITTVVITLVGVIVGLALVYTGKKFHVEIDPRESAVRECLPGNNCGACGFAGCDAMAAAIAKGDAPTNGCPVGGQVAADKNSCRNGCQRRGSGAEGCVHPLQGLLRIHP
ncbi:MAG: hypothetical protein J5891_01950 [Spirochaetales bacterium]|nr:hypothetical protein [Spirochaetales bacterium]